MKFLATIILTAFGVGLGFVFWFIGDGDGIGILKLVGPGLIICSLIWGVINVYEIATSR